VHLSIFIWHYVNELIIIIIVIMKVDSMHKWTCELSAVTRLLKYS